MKRLGLWLAIIFLAAFGLGFGVLAERAFSNLSGDLALGLLTFVGTTWFAIWSFNKTKRKEADAQLFAEKAQRYTAIVEILRDIMFATKGWIPELEEDKLAQQLAKIRYDLIVWGGQDAIRALNAIEEQDPANPALMYSNLINLYAQIRKELGHADDDRLAEELFLAQIVAEERGSIRLALANRNHKQG